MRAWLTTTVMVLGVCAAARGQVNSSESNGVVFATNGVERMRLTQAGLLGINTVAPSTSLHTAGTVRLGSGGESCDANRTGAIRWASSQFQVCYGSGGWALLSSAATSGTTGVPSGAVMAFDLASCPSGWSDYTPARGRFIRGIDNGAGNDPDGTRALGNVQGDELKSHTHSGSANSAGDHSHGTSPGGSLLGNNGNGIGLASSGGTLVNYSTAIANAGAHTHTLSINNTGGTETRPKNVALLYCRKD